jgi:hypothetical protein
MSKATLLQSLLGEIVPKAAAPAAGASLMFPSDDAEAGVKLRLLQEAPIAYNALRKQIIQGQKNGLTPNRVAEKFIHDRKFTNYDGKFRDDPTGFNGYAKKVDGQISGDYWKKGVQNLYNDILGAVDDPDPLVVEAMDGWLESHIGREAGVSMAENRAKALALRKAGGGAVAATAAGGASASDAGFPEWSRYEIGPSHGLPTPTWGDIGESVFNVLGAPMAGLQGLARGVYGLATGEDVVTAGAEAAHMMGSRHKGEGGLMTPGFDSAEGWKRYGDFTEESFNKSGAVTPEIAKALGIINRAPEFISPF